MYPQSPHPLLKWFAPTLRTTIPNCDQCAKKSIYHSVLLWVKKLISNNKINKQKQAQMRQMFGQDFIVVINYIL